MGIDCALSVENWRPVQRVFHLLTSEGRAGLQTSVTVCEGTSLHLCPASPFSRSLGTLRRCILGAAPASLLNLCLLECADAAVTLPRHTSVCAVSSPAHTRRSFVSNSASRETRSLRAIAHVQTPSVGEKYLIREDRVGVDLSVIMFIYLVGFTS